MDLMQKKKARTKRRKEKLNVQVEDRVRGLISKTEGLNSSLMHTQRELTGVSNKLEEVEAKLQEMTAKYEPKVPEQVKAD